MPLKKPLTFVRGFQCDIISYPCRSEDIMKKVISKLNRNEWSCQEGECVIFRSNTSVQSHDLDVTFIGGEDAPSYFEGEGVEKRKEAIRPVEVEYSMV